MAEEPFKTREELKARIKLCGMWSATCTFLAFLFVIIAIISKLLAIVYYDLDFTFWFLLGIFFIAVDIMPNIHLAIYRHLYGIESENKNK